MKLKQGGCRAALGAIRKVYRKMMLLSPQLDDKSLK